MGTRLITRSLYVATEPQHLLRAGECIIGSVERSEILTEWMIGREVAKRSRGLRRHDGRLRKRRGR
ncbi:MAG: hypothetical protein ACYC4L_04700 [Chloroflexota bacterium]